MTPVASPVIASPARFCHREPGPAPRRDFGPSEGRETVDWLGSQPADLFRTRFRTLCGHGCPYPYDCR